MSLLFRLSLPRFFILAFFMFGLSSSDASSGKYCSDKAKVYDIHLFGFTYLIEEQSRLAKKALTDLKAEFAIGDKVRLFSHSPQGFSITFDSCVPGCPETSALEQFFSSECSAQVAKRDRITFERRFAETVLRSFAKAESSKGYDIFASVQALNDSFRAGNKDNEIYAVISLIPSEIKNPRDRKEWNNLLRKADETLQFPKDFPSVKLIGASTDSELVLFWEEVFQSKGRFNFVSY